MMRFAGLACLLLLAAGNATLALADQPRVFYAPEDRALIRTQRLQFAQHGLHAAVAAPVAADAPDARSDATAAPRRAAKLEGIALPRDGRAAAWIGGHRYEDGARLAGYRLRVSRDGVQLLGANGEGPLLKVGQNVGGVWAAMESAP
jgi:hypothetical protein